MSSWVAPPTIEKLFEKMGQSQFSSINRPTSGAREAKEADVGSAPLQLYSLGTPNGKKVSIMLEELGVDYDAHFISIMKGEQFTSGFVKVNPNSKIPALLDQEGPDGKPINVWESASIVLYLAEKYQKFLPKDPRKKVEMMNWIFWQMGGQGPLTGQFGHFFAYAPADKCEAREYGVARYGMEVQRLSDLLDKHLADKEYILGDEYTIADMICFPWAVGLFEGGYKYTDITSADFLNMKQYKHLQAWVDRIKSRPAVVRGLQVCTNGVGKPWLESKQ